MPRRDGGEEWILIDGTPASCVQIGLYHYFQEKGPIDMVISGLAVKFNFSISLVKHSPLISILVQIMEEIPPLYSVFPVERLEVLWRAQS